LGIIPDQIDSNSSAEREAGLVELLLSLRQEARSRRDWSTSDKIRDALKDLGIIVEDRPDGALWKIID